MAFLWQDTSLSPPPQLPFPSEPEEVWTGSVRALHSALQAKHGAKMLLSASKLVMLSEAFPTFGMGYVRRREITPGELLKVGDGAERNSIVLSALTHPPEACKLRNYELSDIPAPLRARLAHWAAAAQRPKRVLVLVNPTSGHKRGAQVWAEASGLFALAGVSATTVHTQRRGHAFETVLRADLANLDGVVVVGGDGTVNEVVSGLLANRRGVPGQTASIPLGIIPAGTDGTFVKFVSHNSLLKATAVILGGKWGHDRLPMDLLSVRGIGGEERLAACGVGWGVPGRVAQESEGLRDMFGVYRYTASTVRNIAGGIRAVEGTIKMRVLDGAALASALSSCGPKCAHCARVNEQLGPAEPAGRMVEVTGKFVLAGLMKTERTITPYCHLADGCFDVFAIPETDLLTWIRLPRVSPEAGCFDVFAIPETDLLTLGGLLAKAASKPGVQVADPKFQHWKATWASIQPSDPNDVFNVDGEVAEGTMIEVSVSRRALTVFAAAF